jgi:hypothetical protein
MRQYRQANPDGGLPISNLAPGAVERTRRLRPSAPGNDRMLAFGGRDLRDMASGLVARTRERNHKADSVVFEDHGIWGLETNDDGSRMYAQGRNEVLLFFGQDAVTTRNFAIHRASFQQLARGMAPTATIYLVHCFAFADGGRLGRMISQATGRPVVGMDVLQTIGNQAHEGQAFRALGGQVTRIGSLPPEVLHFD